jgi:hypothetical protein
MLQLGSWKEGDHGGFSDHKDCLGQGCSIAYIQIMAASHHRDHAARRQGQGSSVLGYACLWPLSTGHHIFLLPPLSPTPLIDQSKRFSHSGFEVLRFQNINANNSDYDNNGSH